MLKCLLLAPFVALAAISPAWADAVTLTQVGVWQSYVTRTDQNTSLCGIATRFADGRHVFVKWTEGQTHLFVQFFKPGWSLPPGTGTEVLRTDKGGRWAGRSIRPERGGDWVEFGIPRERTRDFTHDFTAASSMVVEFSGMSEPPWLVGLAGNSVAVDAMVKCVAAAAGPADGNHPFAYMRRSPAGAPAAARAGAAATEPSAADAAVPAPFVVQGAPGEAPPRSQ